MTNLLHCQKIEWQIFILLCKFESRVHTLLKILYLFFPVYIFYITYCKVSWCTTLSFFYFCINCCSSSLFFIPKFVFYIFFLHFFLCLKKKILVFMVLLSIVTIFSVFCFLFRWKVWTRGSLYWLQLWNKWSLRYFPFEIYLLFAREFWCNFDIFRLLFRVGLYRLACWNRLYSESLRLLTEHCHSVISYGFL